MGARADLPVLPWLDPARSPGLRSLPGGEGLDDRERVALEAREGALDDPDRQQDRQIRRR
jgi:hypothetical protein